MFEMRRFENRFILVFCGLITATASCDGLGGNGGQAGAGGTGGTGNSGEYCTNTPPGSDPSLGKDVPADNLNLQPRYFSDVTLAAGCIHRFTNGFAVEGGAKVTIEPGAIIEVGGGNAANDIWVSDGALIADGTAAAPIEIRPASAAGFGGVRLNNTATMSLRHVHIHDVTIHSSLDEDAPCLTISGSKSEAPKGIVIEDSTFERCAKAGMLFGSELADELTADEVAAMYSSFTRNKIVDSKYGMMVFTESLIGGIKEMPAMSGVTANVLDLILLRDLDFTLLDAGVPWWGKGITLLNPQAKLHFAPGVVFEVHDIYSGPPTFNIFGDGEIYLEGTADKPIVLTVGPQLFAEPGLVSAVKATFRHVRFNGLPKLELGPGSVVENVINENCLGSEKTAFLIYGDDVVFANNTIRNCTTGIKAKQNLVARVGGGNVYENVESNRIEFSSTFVGTSTWKGQSVPWDHDDIRIEGTLTLEPGLHIRGLFPMSGSEVSLFNGAKLIAQGTAQQPVIFDSIGSGPGAWTGIALNGTASAELTYVDLSEASTGIQTNNGSVTITNSTFHDNVTDVYESCGKATVTSSMVTVKKNPNCP